MKKLLLLFIIMFTFSVTTVSVSASEFEFTPSTKITNILNTAGAFRVDSDSDGIGNDFIEEGSYNGNITDGVQTVYADGTGYVFGLNNTEATFIQDHVYYSSYTVVTNATNYDLLIQVTTPGGNITLSTALNETGRISETGTMTASQSVSGFRLIFVESVNAVYATSIYMSISELMIIDLTALYGVGNEPTASEFEELLSASYFSGTVVADEIMNFDNNARISHYMYDVPDIFEDFPNNLTMENIIRIAFFIPLMIIFFLLIPLFNFVLGGTASGSIMLGLLILAFILREGIRFIDPDFHLFGKNSYYEGFKKPKGKD